MQDFHKNSYNDINYIEYIDGNIEHVLVLHDICDNAQSESVKKLVESFSKHKISPIVIDLPFHGEDSNEEVFDLNKTIKKLQSYFWFPNLRRSSTHDIAIFAFGLSSIFALNIYKEINSYNGTIFLFAPEMEYDSALIKRINGYGYKKKDLENNAICIGDQQKLKIDLKLFFDLKENIIKEKIETPNIIVFYPACETSSKIKNNEFYLKKCKRVTTIHLPQVDPYDEMAKKIITHLESDYIIY